MNEFRDTDHVRVLSRRQGPPKTPSRASIPTQFRRRLIRLPTPFDMAADASKLCLAGALGFEPRLSVLETDVLPLTLCPYEAVRYFTSL